MEVGFVKWFDNAKGWGFICRADGSEVFVHYSQVGGDGYRTLRQGQTVKFRLCEGPRGHFAEDVVLQAEAQDQDQDAPAARAVQPLQLVARA